MGGALEPLGESHYQTLAPYNVNTQQTRTRFWDGRDHQLRDDVSWLKGNHLLQFGGLYQHNFNWHQRTDNGGGINYQPVYQLGTSSGAGSGIKMKGFVPAGVPSSKTFGRDYAAVLGLVSASQQAYTRSGANLKLNSPLTPAFDQSTIPYYSLYFSDTWRVKPTISVTYGLGWALEMPPVEKAGKQVEFVDSSNKPIDVQSYLAARQKAALAGQVFNPIVGFDLVHNTHRKYPYDPYYKQFSPRFAVAWNPHFDADSMGGKAFGTDSTVIRAGYGRIYGRLNGVDLVLVPLLGTGLIQAVQCFGPLATGPAGTCGGTPATVFRIEPNSLVAPLPAAQPTLPQPLFPGINGVSAGAGEALDPHFRPNVVDSVDFTIQRQVGRNLTFEAGYIGRYIKHEYQPLNVNAVPYMMTLGGQRFDKAYANMLLQYCGGFAGLAGGGCNAPKGAFALTPQPFFEAALKPTGYCAGFANCTTAVAANEGVNGTGNLNTESV
ncbi:MAG: hypothetical protein DMG68_21405 [Acidobacteria bacterium]|nr:MAG: hypothetical protein DMG68_21405 [Acidobacteriota bacterium]